MLMLTSTLTCGVLLQTVTRIQATEKTRAWVEYRNVLTQSPQVVPVRHALMTPSICSLRPVYTADFVGRHRVASQLPLTAVDCRHRTSHRTLAATSPWVV